MPVQSVIFSKKKWTPYTASRWLMRNHFIARKIDETPKTYRFRQMYPIFARYYTDKIGNGISLVIAY